MATEREIEAAARASYESYSNTKEQVTGEPLPPWQGVVPPVKDLYRRDIRAALEAAEEVRRRDGTRFASENTRGEWDLIWTRMAEQIWEHRSDTFPENPAIADLHADSSGALFEWSGEEWRRLSKEGS